LLTYSVQHWMDALIIISAMALNLIVRIGGNETLSVILLEPVL